MPGPDPPPLNLAAYLRALAISTYYPNAPPLTRDDGRRLDEAAGRITRLEAELATARAKGGRA